MTTKELFKNLAVLSLEHGVPGNVYDALLDLADNLSDEYSSNDPNSEYLAEQLDIAADDAKGYFYLPDNHQLQSWKRK